jgi:hypothetical protein
VDGRDIESDGKEKFGPPVGVAGSGHIKYCVYLSLKFFEASCERRIGFYIECLVLACARAAIQYASYVEMVRCRTAGDE